MIDPRLIDSICHTFERGRSVRRYLSSGSKLVIDQKLPYICVYRYLEQPDPYISSLLKTQGAYLISNSELDLSVLLRSLIDVAIKDFKSYMIVEIWSNPESINRKNIEIWHPGEKISAMTKSMQKGFSEFSSLMPGIETSLISSNQRHPKFLSPLLPLDELKKTGTLSIGLAIPLFFRDAETKQGFPIFFRKIRKKFAQVIQQAAYEFVRVQSDNKFEHYLMLGKSRLDNLVRSADRRISEVSEKMDFILRVTPVNTTEEWTKFQENNFSKLPQFRYRLISLDPEIEKRKLFNIPIENIEHPTLAFLLRDKRMELEKQLIMLEERGTSKFLDISRNIFEDGGPTVKKAALSLLTDQSPNDKSEYQAVNAVDFARAAEAELELYRPYFPGLGLRLKIKDNVTGLIVSGPELSIGKDLTISSARLNALIQHEVGTHILTYCNGRSQPLGLMYTGFAGYEQTQEGMAVLAEYLVGGLDISRLKLLAARVLAVDTLVQGADFIETFNVLTKDFGFQSKTAFTISMRVHRGGGYTKDAIYLKGLMDILDFIKNGGDPAHLYGGKFAMEHLPLIDELTQLRILKKPKIPAFLNDDSAKEKIIKIREGIELKDLIN